MWGSMLAAFSLLLIVIVFMFASCFGHHPMPETPEAAQRESLVESAVHQDTDGTDVSNRLVPTSAVADHA
jgi:hypothetical protein